MKGLEIDPTYHIPWSNLGIEGGGTVSGTSYSKKECYVNCLEICPTQHQAWSNLGNQGGGTVSGTSYSAKECYVNCLVPHTTS